MLVSEIATRVKRQFGDEANAQITDADIIRWVNDAQRELALANNLLQVRATTTPIAGQAEYAIPSGLLTLHSCKYRNVKLVPLSIQEADDLLDPTVTTSGTPTHFYQWSSRLILYPAPDTGTAEDLTLFYTRVPVEITLVSQTPELPVQYHNRILEYCLAQAAELDDNPETYQMKMGEFKSNTQNMKDNSEWSERDFYPTISVSPRDWGDATYAES